MSLQVRNLSWLRSLKVDGVPDFGARMHELISDVIQGSNTLEQQTNSSFTGDPAPPPPPEALKVVPHPQGVQFAITHQSDFYRGVGYHVDVTSGGVTHTYDVGNSRNGVLPVGNLAAEYKVRASYATGQSSLPVAHSGVVQGGAGSAGLLPSQAAGTTLPTQPPGYGGPYRGSKPPVRGSQ